MLRSLLLGTILSASLLVGCGGGGGGGTNPPPVLGQLRTTGSTGLAGVKINFFNSAGQIVGSVTSGANGTLNGLIPATAVTFDFDYNSVPASVYDQFMYGAGEYGKVCGATGRPLVPVAARGTTISNLGNVVFYLRSSGEAPPPPPTCGF